MAIKKVFKVFIVEDDPFFASILQSNLVSQIDLEPLVFSSAEEMLQSISLNPDIILLDYNLDEMNGIDALKRIRDFSADIAVVFISGQEETEVAVDSLKYGAIHYIIKNDKSIERLFEALDEIKTSFFQKKKGKSKRRGFFAK